MNKKVKYKKKPNNLLYQSLVEVRKNIEAMEKKQTRTRKVLWYNIYHLVEWI
jgi:hypothetical protein